MVCSSALARRALTKVYVSRASACGLKPELQTLLQYLFNHAAEAFDPGVNVVNAGVAKVEANGVLAAVVGVKIFAGNEGDVFLDGFRQQFHGIDAFGQRDPKE